MLQSPCEIFTIGSYLFRNRWMRRRRGRRIIRRQSFYRKLHGNILHTLPRTRWDSECNCGLDRPFERHNPQQSS